MSFKLADIGTLHDPNFDEQQLVVAVPLTKEDICPWVGCGIEQEPNESMPAFPFLFSRAIAYYSQRCIDAGPARRNRDQILMRWAADHNFDLAQYWSPNGDLSIIDVVVMPSAHACRAGIIQPKTEELGSQIIKVFAISAPSWNCFVCHLRLA